MSIAAAGRAERQHAATTRASTASLREPAHVAPATEGVAGSEGRPRAGAKAAGGRDPSGTAGAPSPARSRAGCRPAPRCGAAEARATAAGERDPAGDAAQPGGPARRAHLDRRRRRGSRDGHRSTVRTGRGRGVHAGRGSGRAAEPGEPSYDAPCAARSAAGDPDPRRPGRVTRAARRDDLGRTRRSPPVAQAAARDRSRRGPRVHRRTGAADTGPARSAALRDGAGEPRARPGRPRSGDGMAPVAGPAGRPRARPRLRTPDPAGTDAAAMDAERVRRRSRSRSFARSVETPRRAHG